MSTSKPRSRICWECGRKLQGNHFTEKVVDGHPRVLHKSCAEGKGLLPDWEMYAEEDAEREMGLDRHWKD